MPMLADAHISSLGYLWFYVICRRHYLVPYRLQTQNAPVAYEEVLKLILSGKIYHNNLFFWGGGRGGYNKTGPLSSEFNR